MTNKNSAARCIIVLLVIAVACVGLLAILNDLLYVPPDLSVFAKAYKGEYSSVTIEKVPTPSGKIALVAEGIGSDGKEVVGLYTEGSKIGKSDVFKIAVVVSKESNAVVGVFEILDGSTGGYAYDESKLKLIVGKDLPSTNFMDEDSLLITGATNSSNTVQNALNTASEYYKQVYLK